MPQISVPRSFFVKERQTLYADMAFALWRELLQNAVDAGARTIDVSLEDAIRDDGTDVVRIRFGDDGCGMDETLLREVFFSLGETTKTGGDIGGFGRARLLLCFSMAGYEIRTRDCHVVGAGGEYDLVSGLSDRQGAAFTIDVPAHEADRDTLLAALDRVVSFSRLSVCVRLFGEPMRTGVPSGRFVRTLECGKHGPFAHVRVARSGEHLGRVVVRAGGVVMFVRDTRAKARIVVDLIPETARAVLTASRDNLHWLQSNILDAFCQELAVDTTSALRPRRTDRSAHITLGGMYVATKRVARPARPMRAGSQTLAAAAAPVSAPPEVPATCTRASVAPASSPFVASAPTGITEDETDFALARISLGDVFVIDEAESAVVRRAIPRFDPTNWDLPALVAGRPGRGRDAYALMRAWTIACDAAVQALLEEAHTTRLSWTTGWYFGTADETETLALHRQVGNGHVFAIAPVDASGRRRYRLSRREDLLRLVAIARHEVAHVVEPWHDEDFARLLTRLDARMDDARILARMRA